MALDTARATRRLSEAGLSDEAAIAVADLVAEATDGLATQAGLDTGLANLRAEIFRALWLQAAGILAGGLAIAGLVLTAVQLWT